MFSKSFILLTKHCSFEGWKQLADDIQAMLSFRPSLYWICCWLVITPAIAMVTFQ